MSTQRLSRCLRSIVTAINSGNLDSLLPLYERGRLRERAGASLGAPGISEALTGFISMKGELDLDVTRVLEVDDLALVTGVWTFNGTGPDGEPVRLAAKNADVLRRQSDGTWRFVIDNPWELTETPAWVRGVPGRPERECLSTSPTAARWLGPHFSRQVRGAPPWACLDRRSRLLRLRREAHLYRDRVEVDVEVAAQFELGQSGTAEAWPSAPHARRRGQPSDRRHLLGRAGGGVGLRAAAAGRIDRRRLGRRGRVPFTLPGPANARDRGARGRLGRGSAIQEQPLARLARNRR